MKNVFTECLEYSKLAIKTEPVIKNSNRPRTESTPTRKDDKVNNDDNSISCQQQSQNMLYRDK